MYVGDGILHKRGLLECRNKEQGRFVIYNAQKCNERRDVASILHKIKGNSSHFYKRFCSPAPFAGKLHVINARGHIAIQCDTIIILISLKYTVFDGFSIGIRDLIRCVICQAAENIEAQNFRNNGLGDN